MKRTNAFGQAAAVTLCLLLVLSLNAAAANVSPYADKTMVEAGGEVVVTVSLDSDLSGITNFQYSLYFDSSLFERMSVAIGPACAGTQVSGLKNDARGSFYGISFVDTTSLGVDIRAGMIAALTFKAKSDIPEDRNSSFTLEKGSLMDTTWTQVEDGDVSGSPISVTVTFVPPPAPACAVGALTVLSTAGEVLSAVPAGDFLVTVPVTKTAGEGDCLVFLAAYGAAGQFRGLMYVELEDVPEEGTVKITLPVENDGGDIARLKAFCVASFADLTPLGEAAAFPAGD